MPEQDAIDMDASNVTKASDVPQIDAHQHLWIYAPKEFPWIDEAMAALRVDFAPRDLLTVMDMAGVDAAVTVQARQSMEETRWLLEAAAKEPRIAGIVGWADIASREFGAALEEFANKPVLVGLRHVVQAEAPGFLDGEAFNAGMMLLGECDLAFDILIYETQLVEAMRFVDRHPDQRFVLDHCGKPSISANKIQPWARNLIELGRRPNVFCKLSGLTTEAAWDGWTLDGLRPYFDTALEAFGTGRLMVGSDWPVSLLATSYSRWWETLRMYAQALSEREQQDLFGGVAERFYRLRPPARGAASSCS